MDIRASGQALSELTSLMKEVIPTSAAKDVHTCVHLEATTDPQPALIARGVDSQTGIRARLLDVTVKTPGSTLVDGLKLQKVLKGLSREPEVRLALNKRGSNLTVSTDTARHKLHTRDPEDFPPWVAFDDSTRLQLSARKLGGMLAGTTHAASDDHNQRFCINGVLVQVEPAQNPDPDTDHYGTLRTVATDNAHLALMECPLPPPATVSIKQPEYGTQLTLEPTPYKPIRCTISKQGAELFAKLLSKQDEDTPVLLILDKTRVLARTPTFEIAALQLVGDYPPFEGIFRQSPTHTITVQRQDLIQALSNVTVLAGKDSQAVRFTFVSATDEDPQDTLRLAWGERRTGFSEAVIQLTGMDPRPTGFIEVGYGAKHFRDNLKQAQQDEVRLEFNSPLRPLIFRERDEETRTLSFFLQMPMNMPGELERDRDE